MTTETISKSFRKYLSNIPGNHAVKELRKTPIFITAHITFISGFRRDVDVICGLLGNYTASCCNYLPTFRDNVSVPSSRVKIPRRKGTTRRRVITQKPTDYTAHILQKVQT
jgi:hypothetical protein